MSETTFYYEVKIKDLPKMFVSASSQSEVMSKLRQMLKRPGDEIEYVQRVMAADVRKHFRDIISGDQKVHEETYSPQKHEWGTDASAKYARAITPGQDNKKEKKKMSEGKSFFAMREFVTSADKKPQNYRDPITGKTKTRMVPVDKEIIKKEQVDIDPTDSGGEEEIEMAMQQISVMRHYLDGIEERIESSDDMEEWFQNKLTKASVYLETLYSYSKGDLGESLRKDIATNSGKFPEGSHVYHAKTDKIGKVMTVGKDFVKVAHAKSAGRNGQVRYQMKDYHPSELQRVKTRTTPKKYKIGGRDGEIV